MLAVTSASLSLTLFCFSCPRVASGANLQASLSSAITLQRPDGALVQKACGTVFIQQSPKSQEFRVTVNNIPSTQPTDGLAVFISDSPGDTNNFYFVNVLNGVGSNGTWRLDFKTKSSPAPQLHVLDLTNLTGRIVFIADAVTNVYLETIIPPFVPSLSKLTYNRRVQLQRPEVAPSPNAIGTVRVKLNGRTGASSIQTKVKNLYAGNSYCCWIGGHSGSPTGSDCPKTPNLVTGTAVFGADSGTGEQLAYQALDSGVVAIDQFSGLSIEILDQFGTVHLQGIIP